MEKLFPLADSNSIFEDEDNQTFDIFVEMGKRKPNIKGTGRYKLNKKRNKILIIYFGLKDSIYQNNDFIFLCNYLSTFFLLDVEIIYQYDAIDINNGIFKLDGLEYDNNINNLYT